MGSLPNTLYFKETRSYTNSKCLKLKAGTYETQLLKYT